MASGGGRLRAALPATTCGLALLTAVLTVAPQTSRSANPPGANEQLRSPFVGTQVDDERRWDVTDHLRTGTNTFEVKVRTTLRNAVTKYNQNSTVMQPYGLRGPIRLDPYDSVVVYDPRR